MPSQNNPFDNTAEPQAEQQDIAPGKGPTQDIWGRKQDRGARFFKLPTNIGRVYAGETDYHVGDKALPEWVYNLAWVIGIVGGLAIAITLLVVINPDDVRMQIALFVLPVVLAFFITYRLTLFSHANGYLGTEGFAIYQCDRSKSNLVLDVELRWEQFSELKVARVDHYTNGAYTHTKVEYHFLDRMRQGIVFTYVGYTHRQKRKGEWPVPMQLLYAVEQKWAARMLENLGPSLAQGQPYTFWRFDAPSRWERFVTLSPTSLTFYKGSEEFTYQVQDIQRIFAKRGVLHIQHKNFEQILYFFRKGNENLIQLNNLCNQQLFFVLLARYFGDCFRDEGA